MPARSQAQRAYLNWRFGHAWVKRHHFDTKGNLPARSLRNARGRLIAQAVRSSRRHARIPARTQPRR